MSLRPLFAAALLFMVGCKGSGSDAASSASAAAASSVPKSAKSGPTATASAAASAKSAGADEAALGGADWKAVFQGDSPLELGKGLGDVSSGGAATGMGDDYTRHIPFPLVWGHNEAGGGTIYRSPTEKTILVTNANIKLDPTNKTIDLWSKSALVKDLKMTNGPEVIELGPTKTLVLAGSGTCLLKSGSPADVYWFDMYSPGDFAHNLQIVFVAKDAPLEEKQIAIGLLRKAKATDKAKPHYKKS